MRGFSLWLLVCLWAQAFVSPLHASGQLSLQSGDNLNDIVPICTGRDVRWISISQTDVLGQFVFVDPPIGSNELNVTCPWVTLTDLPQWLVPQSDIPAFALVEIPLQVESPDLPDPASIFFITPPATGPPAHL